MAEPTERDAVPDVPPDGATVEVDGEVWEYPNTEPYGYWQLRRLALDAGSATYTQSVVAPSYHAWTALWRERELRRREQARTCEWQPWDESSYDTGCGGGWDFEQGDLPENEAVFCPLCGGRIVVVGEKGADAEGR